MYTQFFNLQKMPFTVTSDPEFLFLSQRHREAIDALLYGVEQRVGFIEITGEIGCGKTTVCRALLNRMPQNIKSAYIFNSSLSEIQLLQTLMADLGVKHDSKNRHELFDVLNKYLIDQLKIGNNVILIIDEAQNLPVKLLEQVRMLSNLETDKEKLIQIIFVGQPELRDKLNLPELKQLRQRIAVRYHIGNLELSEMEGYIYHRLTIAGCETPKDLFPRETIAEVHKHSEGVPRVINLICDKALLSCFARGYHRVTPGYCF